MKCIEDRHEAREEVTKNCSAHLGKGERKQPAYFEDEGVKKRTRLVV